jgi:peptidoglycan hydrolase-like protein with peptidoglycan-binding domain
VRAKNMQALTNDIKRRYPGVVVYGVGDDAHKTRYSDHNEDDTPGSLAAQSDADNVPEHRAIDVMQGPNLSDAQCDQLVANLVSDPASQRRLMYIISDGSIWSRKNGWTKTPYDGSDSHSGHAHISGDAKDDENDAPWPAVDKVAPDPTPQPPTSTVVKKGDSGVTVSHIQQFLRNNFPVYRNYVGVKRGQLLVVDGDFGDQTEAWVKEFQRRTNLVQDGMVGPKTFAKMRQFGYRY